jgi:hypothetical protein
VGEQGGRRAEACQGNIAAVEPPLNRMGDTDKRSFGGCNERKEHKKNGAEVAENRNRQMTDNRTALPVTDLAHVLCTPASYGF